MISFCVGEHDRYRTQITPARIREPQDRRRHRWRYAWPALRPRRQNGRGLAAWRAATPKLIQDVIAGESNRPDWLFEQCHRIAKALENGQIALAQILGLHIPVKELDESQMTCPAAAVALSKAKYTPDQPRVPAGQPGGRQWTSDGDDRADPPKAQGRSDAGADAFGAPLQSAGYPLSQAMWQVARDLYRLYGDSGEDIATLPEYLAGRGLKLDDLPDVIQSAFDPPKRLRHLQTDKPARTFDTEGELRAYLGDPPSGYEWHHIIEQNGQIRPDLTRACRQLSQMIAAARWMAARKFRAVLS